MPWLSRFARGCVLPLVLAAAPTALTTSACGASADAPPTDDLSPSNDTADAGGGAPDVGSSPDTGTPARPCDPKQAEAIQARFEADAPDDIDAVAMIKDPSCGVRYFTRGPSKVGPEALHLLASNAKTYVASLILLLVEDGLVRLDDSVSKWIEAVPGGDALVVRHLLEHSSGIYNYSDSTTFRAQSTFGKKYAPRDLVDLAFEQKVGFPPGAGWGYSNTNYVLLGMIAEKATGKPVEVLLRERILSKIGAKATFFYGKEPVVGDIAPGKTFLGSKNGATFNDPSTFWCAGSLVGTPADLLAWAELRGSGQFHSPAANAEIFKTVKAEGPYEYGAGLMVFSESVMHGGGKAYGHGGDLVGYHSYGLYFPDWKATVVLIVDSDKGPKGAFPFAPTYRDKLWYSVIDPLFGYTAPPAGDAGLDASTGP